MAAGDRREVLDALLDVAHGSRCACCRAPGRVLCAACAQGLPVTGHRVTPDPAPPGLAPAYAAGWYDDPLRGLLITHKEHRAFGLARPLGGVLAGVAATAIGTPRPGWRVVLVPVPSRPAVVRARGHDPVSRMVRAAAAELRGRGHDAVPAALLRQVRTVADQAGLDAGERAANLADLLAVEPRIHRWLARGPGPCLVVLCDDVITTGSTAREGQRALSAVGISVGLIATVAATRKRLPVVTVRAESA